MTLLLRQTPFPSSAKLALSIVSVPRQYVRTYMISSGAGGRDIAYSLSWVMLAKVATMVKLILHCMVFT